VLEGRGALDLKLGGRRKWFGPESGGSLRAFGKRWQGRGQHALTGPNSLNFSDEGPKTWKQADW